jgi:hypothetical protein
VGGGGQAGGGYAVWYVPCCVLSRLTHNGRPVPGKDYSLKEGQTFSISIKGGKKKDKKPSTGYALHQSIAVTHG